MIQKREQRKYFKYITKMLGDLLVEGSEVTEVRKIISEGRLIECSVRYMAKNTYADMGVFNRIMEICVGLLGREIPDHEVQAKFQQVFEVTDSIGFLFRVLRAPLEEERMAYSKYLYNQERIFAVSSTQELSYETSGSTSQLTGSLRFFASLVRGKNKPFK